MAAAALQHLLLLLMAGLCSSSVGPDDLGLANGYVRFSTKNFDIKIAHDAQVLASLRPAGSSFDFLPFDYMSRRARNGQYHWGDITLRYRTLRNGTASGWTDVDSALARKPVSGLHGPALAAASLAPTLPARLPLNISREWIDVDGDLGLRFTVANTGSVALEMGSLGFPAEVNSIFTGRTAEQIQDKCSLADAYVGMSGGFIRVVPVRGNESALVITPLGDTPLEASRNLDEASYADTAYGSQTFEGFYEWQVFTKAWADKEWASTQPWNPPSSRILQPGQSTTFGLRFSVAQRGVRDIDSTIGRTGTPVVMGVPGYILPRDLPAQLFVKLPGGLAVNSTRVDPPGALRVSQTASGSYQIVPSSQAWGRTRLSLAFSDGRVQTVHYYVTKPATQAVAELGRFLTTSQWFTNRSDPFNRAPSVMTYDYEAGAIALQDSRVWIAGLSDEAGAGSFLAAAMKQSVQANEGEIRKLEEFVSEVLWGTIQTTDFAVRKSAFFYEPAAVPGYRYNQSLSWTGWQSWNKTQAYGTDRAYDYVHVAATYWALYRAGRTHPDLLRTHLAEWYLDQSYRTIMRCMAVDSGGAPVVKYSHDGLMGETVLGELLSDLQREGKTAEASSLEASMRARAKLWNAEAVPFGSEMAWDSTGQEGIFYWSTLLGYEATATKALNTVLGFDPVMPHWGWNGNARRYWDNLYGGKLRRIERQIHYYGSGLNALVLLSAFRSNPGDLYLLRAGYAGMNGPLSNINQDGFASASFHSWPDTLKWDGYSGDYGPSFVGLAIGAATYLVEDPELGTVAYGGIVDSSGPEITVQTRDAVRRRVFIAPLKLFITIDAGIIDSFTYRATDRVVSLKVGQLEGTPLAQSTVIWLETTAGSDKFTVTTPVAALARLGWQVNLNATTPVVVVVSPEREDTKGNAGAQ